MIKKFTCELPGNNPDAIKAYKQFLTDNNIKWDSCGCYCNVLFTVWIDPENVSMLDDFIDSLY